MINIRKIIFITCLFLLPAHLSVKAVDLYFENPDSGFFLRPDEQPNLNSAIDFDSSDVWDPVGDDGSVVDTERFTVLDPTRPALIRATYGPFSTKQTVPARYVLPEFPDEEDANNTLLSVSHPLTIHSHQLEVSAHLVIREVTRARPTVRVLIHGAGARGHHSPHVCVTVLIKKGSDILSASCNPIGAGETGGDATCLISLSIPSHWWPPHTRATVKLPRTIAKVYYLVGTASGPQECVARDSTGYNSFQNGPRVTVQPETEVGEVSLTLDAAGYDEISSDPLVHILVPRTPLYPGTIIHAPLYLYPRGNLPALVFTIRCKVRNGIRITGVESSNPAWKLTLEFNSRKTTASVDAMLIDQSPDNSTLHNLGLHEVFSWILEVPADAMQGDTKVTWTLQYVMDAHHHEIFASGGNRKMNTKFHIQKDDIQAVLPIAKSWSIVNTAVLTGRQVSRAMKVLMISQAGKAADITLQSSCTCTDEAALKVSTSCTSVYLDGSEVRGSHNATVVARYGQKSGSAAFTVWMPEFPLLVHVEDSKLSQIKGWHAPKSPYGNPYASKVRATLSGHDDDGASHCGIRYQQTPVQVYGRFVAVDDNSGRESYLLSRNARLRVTELITHLLRVADTSIATLNNTIVRGKAPGRTEVQVLSPITGRVIGDREIRVGTDKVWVTKLHATVISGLALSLQLDPKLPDIYSAITKVTPTLTAKYQEGLIDVWIEFSDTVVTPLREVLPEHYVLKVRSLDPNVVAVAPSPRMSSAQQRVIATGHGEGKLLQVGLELSDMCTVHRTSLASTVVTVKVDLIGHSSFLDTDGNPNENSLSGRNDELSEIPIADAAVHDHYILPDISRQPAVQARMNPSQPAASMTPLEVGMYVLLAVFGIAIAVFAGSSVVVYTWRAKGRHPQMTGVAHYKNAALGQDSVTNAHDWVWLGRATLERASGIVVSPNSNKPSGSLMPQSDLNGNNNNQQSSWKDHYRFLKGASNQMNITNNPSAELEPLLKGSTETSMNLSGSFTFTRPSKSQRRVTFNNLSRQLAQGGTKNQLENCPPIPPHRNIGVNANLTNEAHSPLTEIGAPPVPPHGINVISNPMEARALPPDSFRVAANHLQSPLIIQQKDDEEDETIFSKSGEKPQEPKFVEVNADDFVRLRGVTRSRAAQVRRATILENPLLSAALPDNLNITDHLDNLPPTMDYEQLMEYFSNLKESNA